MHGRWQEFNEGWHLCHSWQRIFASIISAMFALLLLGLFVLLAIVSLVGLTADSRDLRPRLPVQAPGNQPDFSRQEQLARTALPPHPRARIHRP